MEIETELIQKYGKITGISATFFEKTNEEDARRTWLFKPENGGIFLDWIHPVEITSHVLKAESWKLIDARTFLVQPLYDTVNPTAVEAKFEINGGNFKPSSVIHIRVGKGFDFEHKRFRLNFENDSVDLDYLSTEEEVITGKRGEMKITGDKRTIIPNGPLSYEIMIDGMLGMLRGMNPSLSLDDAIKIYEPVWQFQEISKEMQPIRSKEEIKRFAETQQRIA